MNINQAFRWARHADKQLSRRLSDKRRLLINARTAMNFAIVSPIYKALRDDPRIEFYFTASEKPQDSWTIYREGGLGLKVVNPRRAAIIRFDAYLVADVLWMTLPRGTPRVLMFHGVAGKYSHVYDSPERSMRAWDRLFFINRRRMKNFALSGAIAEDSAAARLVGYPKIDCLVDGSLKRDRILADLGIDPARRTVLYAPTWSPYSSLNTHGEQLIRNLCDAGYAVIVKLHDRSRDPLFIHSGGIDWVTRLDPILRKTGGLVADGADASPYMVGADVLITDHSSAGFEYLLLNRPLIRIEMPELIARTNIPEEYVKLMRDASITTRNPVEVVNAVGRALNNPTEQSDIRKAIAEELFYDPGHATARAGRELYELIELDPLSESMKIHASSPQSQFAFFKNP